MDTTPAREEPGPHRQPGALELLPLLPIVLVVAWTVRTFELLPWVSTGAALAISMAGAALIGLPALFWALDHGRRGLIPLTLIGTLAGLTPLLVILASAVLGLLVRVGFECTLHTLQLGAPMPAMGVMPWWTFVRAELPAAAIGAISAATYWLISAIVGSRKR